MSNEETWMFAVALGIVATIIWALYAWDQRRIDRASRRKYPKSPPPHDPELAVRPAHLTRGSAEAKPAMKYLKWAAIGIGGLTLLVIFSAQDVDSRRWGMAGGAVAWFGYVVLDKLERIRAEIAVLKESLLNDLHKLRSGADRCEELLEELRARKD